MMLRTTSLENYDAWVAGTLPFDSPEVKKAIETWSELWFNDAFVFGGRSSIVSTFFGDSPAPMFDDPPGCWMHKQGNFITGFFPAGTEADVDYGFFYLPPVDDAYGKRITDAVRKLEARRYRLVHNDGWNFTFVDETIVLD